MQHCRICKQYKKLDEFDKSIDRKGYQARCRNCITKILKYKFKDFKGDVHYTVLNVACGICKDIVPTNPNNRLCPFCDRHLKLIECNSEWLTQAFEYLKLR